MLSMDDMQMGANRKITFYYLKLKDGKFQIRRKIEQPAFVYDVVGEVLDEDTAKEHVERLNKDNEELSEDR